MTQFAYVRLAHSLVYIKVNKRRDVRKKTSVSHYVLAQVLLLIHVPFLFHSLSLFLFLLFPTSRSLLLHNHLSLLLSSFFLRAYINSRALGGDVVVGAAAAVGWNFSCAFIFILFKLHNAKLLITRCESENEAKE